MKKAISTLFFISLSTFCFFLTVKLNPTYALIIKCQVDGGYCNNYQYNCKSGYYDAPNPPAPDDQSCIMAYAFSAEWCCLPNPPPPPPPSCGSIGGYCALEGHQCGLGYTAAGSNYDCGTYSLCCVATTCESIGGYCPSLGHRCAPNYTYTSSPYECSYGCCIYNPPPPPPPACSSGATNCTGWNGGQGTNQCGNVNQNRTCDYNSPPICYLNPYTQYQTIFINNCSNNYTCTNGNTCTTNIYVHVYTDYNHDQIKDGNDSGIVGVAVTDGGGNYPTTDGNGNVTFGGKTTGYYTISINVPGEYTAVGPTSQGVNLSNNSGNVNVNFFVTPLYTVSGNLFNDNNHNQKYDSGDSLYTNKTTIHVNGGPTGIGDMSQTSGTYSTGQVLESGTYTFSQTAALPQGYSYTTPSSWTITVGNRNGYPTCNTNPSPDATCVNPNNGSITNLNFGINPPYQISGYVYNDVNKNYIYDNPPDQPISAQSISVTGPTNTTVTTDANGYYNTGQILLPGKYVVTDTTPLSPGYKDQTLNTFTVTVGYNPACNTGGNPDATCGDPNGGSLNNLNFIQSDEIPHGGNFCTDQRFDSGFINPLPANPANGTTCGTYYVNGVSYNLYNYYAEMCTNSNNPPIAYSGATNPFHGTAGGQASSPNYQVGNTTYPETYSPVQPGVIETSYEYLTGVAASSGIDLTDPTRQLSNFCSLSSCNLPANLPDNIYVANSDVTFNAYTFPLGKNYVFLIKGNLTINGNILIPTGSDAAFAVTGNIYVNPTVGESSMTSSAANIEGLYTTDQSFIINRNTTSPTCNTDGTPIDLRLNIVGSVVVNATNTGGTFQNNRDFCIDDLTCPVYTTGGEDGNPGGTRPGAGNGLTYILNAPLFIMHKNYFFQEVNP